jgi:dihydropteroate synthase-like protein
MPAPLPRLLFLTGRLAEPALRRVLAEIAHGRFKWEVREMGLQVAALMTADMIRRRLPQPNGFDRVLVPGRCSGDVEALSAHFGLPVERGPDELADLPEWFGGAARRVDLSRHSVRLFAEIVDAPKLTVAEIVERAGRLAADGADVIDLGCLPETPFPHLVETIAELKRRGYAVSVDSHAEADLRLAIRAGADHVLSLTEHTLHLVDEGPVVPVVIPARRGAYASLARAVRAMQSRGRAFYADPVLEPIHFGFTDSLVRYRRLRREFPDVAILMGIGNVTELTDADTSGINALLFGIVSELSIGAVLSTSVSLHARRAVAEADIARRMMFAARADNALPRGYTPALMAVHEKRPFPQTFEDVRALAAQVRDPSFRVQITAEGLHVYNRDGLWSAQEPFALYPNLKLAHDGSHAFYMGVELARAEIAWRLGKRYVQDRPLDWRVAEPPRQNDGAETSQEATEETRPDLERACAGNPTCP